VSPTPSPISSNAETASTAPSTSATTTSTATPTPSPASLSTPAGSGLLISAFLSGAVIAAVVGATVNVGLAPRKSLEEERARQRIAFAEAFEVVTRYKEFPYAIRRRRADEAAEERVRLSEGLREVQARLSYYIVWIEAESEVVGQSYETLVAQLRATAGRACHDAWLAPPAEQDADMNSAPGLIDLSDLRQYELAYIATVQQHLKQMRHPKRTRRGS
jgi:gas vesicle protein